MSLEDLNTLCNQNVITDYIPENHRIRFLHGCKFDVQESFDLLIASETSRYELGCDRITGQEVFDYGHRAGSIIGRDIDGRPVIYTRCADWLLGIIPPE